MAIEFAEHALKLVIATTLLLMWARYLTQDASKQQQSGGENDGNEVLSSSACASQVRDLRERLEPLQMFSTQGLVGVVIVARHGDRAPSVIVEDEREFWEQTLLPNTAAYNEEFPISDRITEREGPSYPFGWLTKQGICEMRALGQWLRERYRSLVDNRPANARFYSTDYERTARSAAAVASFFNSDRPVQSLPRELDPMDPWESIPEYQKAVYDFEAKNETFLNLVTQTSAAARDVYSALKGRYFKQESSFAWISAYDVFVSASAHPNPGRSVDQLLNTPMKSTVYNVTLAEFQCLYRDARLRKLAVGGLLGGLANWISYWATGNIPDLQPPAGPRSFLDLSYDSRFAFVSCHDVNVLPLRMALGWDYDPTWPKYGSFLAFEIYSNKKIRIVDSEARVRTMTVEQFVELSKATLNVPL